MGLIAISVRLMCELNTPVRENSPNGFLKQIISFRFNSYYTSKRPPTTPAHHTQWWGPQCTTGANWSPLNCVQKAISSQNVAPAIWTCSCYLRETLTSRKRSVKCWGTHNPRSWKYTTAAGVPRYLFSIRWGVSPGWVGSGTLINSR